MSRDTTKIPGFDEVSIFTPRHDLQKQADPTAVIETQAFKGKVVLITGGSAGIGGACASLYARTGAYSVLVARDLVKLQAKKAEILRECPDARVELVSGDLADPDTPEKAVRKAVETFGGIDILIVNAGRVNPPIHRMGDGKAEDWRYSFSVNVFGTYGLIHAALPELEKTKGQIVFTSSLAAHMRWSVSSDYTLSKHMLNRMMELLTYEYSWIKTYSVHPGVVDTRTCGDFQDAGDMHYPIVDKAEHVAAVYLWLTSRKAEFLSGRYIEATWDLDEILAKKDEIVRDNLLVTKLAGPLVL
ncbi:NAD(P)-binding protein [Peniophora sp. CONT]|nr:NAD(P)-binding protein [Peniophora sp. CONT]